MDDEDFYERRAAYRAAQTRLIEAAEYLDEVKEPELRDKARALLDEVVNAENGK